VFFYIDLYFTKDGSNNCYRAIKKRKNKVLSAAYAIINDDDDDYYYSVLTWCGCCDSHVGLPRPTTHGQISTT